MKLRHILLAGVLTLAPIPALAQTVSTQLSPIKVTLVQEGQVPVGTSNTVSVTCQGLVGITGGQTQQAVFTGPGSVTLNFPLTTTSSCTFSTAGDASYVVGGLPRTGAVPVTQATEAVVTVSYPAVTVRNVVVGAGPSESAFTLACSTNNVAVPLNPAVFNGNFTLAAGASRTFGVNDIAGLTRQSVCETRLVGGNPVALSYTSSTGTTVINGQVVPNPSLGGVIVAGNFQSALTQANGQTIVVTQAYPPAPQPATTVAPATTTTQVTTTTVPATVPATTAPATTVPAVTAAPPVAVVVEPSFTG